VRAKKRRARRSADATAGGPASSPRLSPAHKSYIYKIGVLRRLLDRYSTQTLTEKSGLTLAEWRVLTTLYSSPPINARQLRLELHTDKAEVSRACAGLIARGYVRRRVDPADKRSSLIVISKSGERMHDAVIPVRQAFQKELESALNPAQVTELHDVLDKLIRFASARTSKRPGSASSD
jgi:DNA-binding MarR family transcriptional regulator